MKNSSDNYIINNQILGFPTNSILFINISILNNTIKSINKLLLLNIRLDNCFYFKKSDTKFVINYLKIEKNIFSTLYLIKIKLMKDCVYEFLMAENISILNSYCFENKLSIHFKI